MRTIFRTVIEYDVIDYRGRARRYGPFRYRIQAEAAAVAVCAEPWSDPKSTPEDDEPRGVVIECREVEETVEEE